MDFDLSKVIVQEDFSYGPHDLQTLKVYNPVGSQHNEDGYFIIYIHGGAWRDPLIDAASLLPTLTQLLASPSQSTLLSKHVRAFASLSYRLSPHPSFPQSPPPETPPFSYRDARHPQHLQDILSGLAFLQRKYGFGSRYILVGHSCGATLALQCLMHELLLDGQVPGEDWRGFMEPEVIIGISGIYNLRLLRDSNSHPAYQEFLSSAFGTSEDVWDTVSPGLWNGQAGENPAWALGKMLVLVSSSGDELVDISQIEGMAEMSENWQSKQCGKLRTEVWKDMLSIGHDEIWSGGLGMASVLERVLELFFENGGAVLKNNQ